MGTRYAYQVQGFFFPDWAIMIGPTQKRKPLTFWKSPNIKISILDGL